MRYGNFLRGNDGLPPWRNSVTHDVPHRTATQDWVLWEVDVVEIHLPAPSPSQNVLPQRDPSRKEAHMSLDSLKNSPPKSDGRLIYYAIADENGDVDDAIEWNSFLFKGTNLDQLLEKVEEETELQNVIICSRNPLNGKLYPLRLQLPPNNAAMRVILVEPSSRCELFTYRFWSFQIVNFVGAIVYSIVNFRSAYPYKPLFLIDGYCRKGEIRLAIELLEEMKTKGFLPTVVSYGPIINGLCLKGKFKAAEKHLTDMRNRGLTINAFIYNNLINGLCKHGNMNEAMKVFRRMEENDVIPDIVTYNSLISGFCMEGKAKEAVDLMKMSVEQNLVPNKFTYTSLIHVHCKVGEVSLALYLFVEMLKKGHQL